MNQEKRAILAQQGQEDEMDQRESGGILDQQGHKEQEDQGVRAVSGDPLVLLAPTVQRVLLVSPEYLVTAETQGLQGLRGTEDRQDLADQWVCQEKRAFQDFLDLVERRDPKEKQGRQDPPEYQVAGALQVRGAAQDLKENVADRDPKDRQETQGSLARMVQRESPANQAWTVKTVHRVSQEQQDRKVPWDRQDL